MKQDNLIADEQPQKLPENETRNLEVDKNQPSAEATLIKEDAKSIEKEEEKKNDD